MTHCAARDQWHCGAVSHILVTHHGALTHILESGDTLCNLVTQWSLVTSHRAFYLGGSLSVVPLWLCTLPCSYRGLLESIVAYLYLHAHVYIMTLVSTVSTQGLYILLVSTTVSWTTGLHSMEDDELWEFK